VDPGTLSEPVVARLEVLAGRAGLAVPALARAPRAGGRDGVHTEHLAPLLAETQGLARQYPGARW
jgi:ring-1,2-phenylacetyl-CoA epoxidase subunit PaaC